VRRLSGILAIAAIAALAALEASACGNSAPEVQPTATPQFAWLTESRQGLLRTDLTQVAATNGWVAACVFESQVDASVFDAVAKPAGRVFYTEFTDEALNPALVIRVEGQPAAKTYKEFRPNFASFCLLPG
jgi:hypothetical protein